MAKKTIKKINKALNTKRAVRWMWIVLIAPVTVLFIILLMTASGMFGKLPTFEELENPKSNLATMVYSEDGEVIGSYFYQNRTYTSYEELSPNLVAALVATEDARFYSHSGIDFMGLARVAVKTVALGQNQGGGSTITQQLAKNLYKTRDTVEYNNKMSRKGRLYVSKLKEWITAVGLEYNYTKEEIIAMYLNTVEYGNNAYGIKSAAQTYFNKLPDELTIEEAALLVGVVNAPTKYSPTRNPKQSVARRNVVLSRMHDRGFIATRAERDSLMAIPLNLEFRAISHNTGVGTYFREMIRQVMTMQRPQRSSFNTDWDYQQAVELWDNNPIYGWCHKNLKADGTKYNIYSDGLRIYTTLNSTMQRYAEEAVVEHLSKEVQPALDKQVKAYDRLFSDINKDMIEQIINQAMVYSDRYRVMDRAGVPRDQIIKTFDQPVEMSVFSYHGDIDTVMTPRDSILYHKQIMRASFMAMDPQTGHVKAYVGGPSFNYFKYDMVKQGKRQIGSTMKPFVYTFAIDHLQLSPCTMVPNWPVTIETYDGEPWSPKEAGGGNYDGQYHPLKWGLAQSRNNYTAWIMKQANPQAVADYIHKLGIRGYIDPVPALCLGSPDVTVFEMVASYSTYANRGVYTEPVFVTRIEDRQGNVLATFIPQTTDVIGEQTAYTMLNMLKEVVEKGTGGRLKWKYNVKGEAGGKTGTSQQNADAWFIGVTPRIVGGAWVGGEDMSIRLYREADGARLALPIFANFMNKVHADKTLGITPDDKFPVPLGAVVEDCVSTIPNPYATDIYGPDDFFY